MPQQIDFDPNVDYYKALGVTDKASADEIKKAYRKLAKQYHPDSTGGDKKKEAQFKTISAAYDVLGDEKKKGLYDQIRAHGGGIPGAGGGGRVYQSQGGASGPSVFDLGDLFSQLFNGQVPRQGQPGGGGQRVRVEQFPGGQRVSQQHIEDADFESKVRASDGSWLKAEGLDLHSDLRIGFDRAILGTVATVATVDGKAEVKVPPGTSSGKKLRLRGKGLSERGGHTGDHYVTIQIDVPNALDEESKKLVGQLVSRLRKHKPGD